MIPAGMDAGPFLPGCSIRQVVQGMPVKPSKLPTLDASSELPLYRQVKDWLRAGIQRGWWPVGTVIPSERSLSESLGVSRATLRQAVTELGHEGWLIPHQGKGTFVAQPKLEQPLDRLRGFSENMRALGVVPSARVLSAQLQPATPEIAAALGLEEGEAVAQIRRLRLADGVALMVEACHLRYERTLGVLEADLSGSLYALLEQRYGICLGLGWETLEVRPAEARVWKALGIEPRSMTLYTERLARDEFGTPIEFTQRYARADRCRFRLDVEHGKADFTLNDRTRSTAASGRRRGA